MKPIKIIPENATAIEGALRAVNGRAKTHVYNHAFEILDIAATAERHLELHSLPRANRPGAEWWSISGGHLPSAYDYHARATRVAIRRRAAGWYLTEIEPAEIYGGNQGRRWRLLLTPAQDAKVIEVVRRGYTIIERGVPAAPVERQIGSDLLSQPAAGEA